jgi:glycosyltransferase involved in cell wall biosynthesis
VDVLPFPINTSEFSPQGSTNSSEILFVGRINAPRKNTALLLRAFSKVLEEVPEAELTLVGEKPNEKLRSLITKLGIESAVNIGGQVPNVVPYYRRAAVFALPSNQEGLGIVGLEAQSCGTPVVSTNCGGPRDYIIDGENGFLVPVGDEDAFSTSLTTMLTDEELRNRFGTRSREMVVKNYASSEIKHELQKHIKSI